MCCRVVIRYVECNGNEVLKGGRKHETGRESKNG